ncbi:hypothetical protein D3P08_14765 [Paenibacillus nanensis]|uniref:Tissue inhibitor of metalloproteinase n=1 Tax=Paenibacillus nanensis TaxID=393251 RepID=A0A3A1UTV1_9BACL|nr:hypothetical protein [Paenibacillus nanensis]RIX51684.1 hypothetical protein D3P08_14765 [Paenibacillus nanensis]
MRVLAGLLLLLVLLPLSALSRPDTAYACDCAIPDNAAEALQENAAVFTGKALAMKGTKWTGQYDDEFDAVLFEVERIWKGVEQSQIIVYNPISSCQYDFKTGSSYLVYANLNGGEWVVSNCSRTAEVTQASSDISELGSSVPPRQQVNLLTTFHASSWFNIGAVTALAIVLILVPLAFLVYRYRTGRE